MQDSRINFLAQIDFSAFVKVVQRINIGHYKQYIHTTEHRSPSENLIKSNDEY